MLQLKLAGMTKGYLLVFVKQFESGQITKEIKLFQTTNHYNYVTGPAFVC